MVTKDELIMIARRENVPLGMIEKDYVLSYMLKKIYGSHLKDKLAFKGGTALHKLYLHKRISIDLDFTEINKITFDELKSVIIDKEINSKIKDVNETDVSLKIVLSYNSLLNYPNYIIIDISRREKPIMDLVAINMKSEYFKDIAVTTFQIEELISEKLRALIERKKPRDYLDIYYILDEKEINWKKTFEIAKKKLNAVNEKFDIQKIIGDTDIVKELWKQDISELVADIPPFDKVLQKITDFLKKNANKI